MANINEAFDSLLKSRETVIHPQVNKSSFSSLPDVLYPINDMGHLEFINKNGTQVRIMELYKLVGKNVKQTVDSNGIVNMSSEFKTKTYNIHGTDVLIDFSKLR